MALFPLAVLALLEVGARVLHLDERVSGALAIPQWIDSDLLARKTALRDMHDRPDDLRMFYRAYRPDRFLFYRMKPDLAVPMVDILVDEWRNELRWTLDTNGSGYRGRQAALDPPSGTFRIACLGDSSTYGWGLDVQESYPAALQRTLDRRYGAGRFEVLNFGVPGYTSFQGSVLLRREVLRYQPHAVTIAYGANDDARVAVPARERYARAASWVGGMQEILRQSRAYGALKGVLILARGRSAGVRLGDASRRATGGKPEVSRDDYEALLTEMIRTLRGRGIDVVLVAQCMARGRESRIHVLRQLERREGVPRVDLFKLYEASQDVIASDVELRSLAARYETIYGADKLRERRRLRFLLPDGCHPNALLAELAGRYLAQALEASGGAFKKYVATGAAPAGTPP